MSPDVLARLRKEAEQPAGIAPIIDSPELKRLLEERDDLRSLVEAIERATNGGSFWPLRFWMQKHKQFEGDLTGTNLIAAACAFALSKADAP